MRPLVLIAAVSLAACHATPSSSPAPITRHVAIAAGEFAEVNLVLPAGATVDVTFEAGAPVAWNIHSHPAGEVVIHQEGTSDEGTIPFTAASAGGYSYLWENKGADPVELDVTVRLPDGAHIDSWHPE
jgi:hypothetical protein